MDRPTTRHRAILQGGLLAAAGVVSLATLQLVVLLGAAAAGKRARRTPPRSPGTTPIIVLIPAHDEEAGLGATLESVRQIDYPKQQIDVVVVADNCTDQTAEVARTAGATVYERVDPERRGKGYALRWALDRLAVERPSAELIVFLDADCLASPNLLRAIEARYLEGADAVQVPYAVRNPSASWSSGLRYAAFALFNIVQPLGNDTLGLSAGLSGTGMAFSRALLNQHPWEAYSLAEDMDYSQRLAAAGVRVRFAAEARVDSDMPISLKDAREQQLRWEGGRVEMIRRWTPRLLRDGLQQRDPRKLYAALDPLVPPQSLLFAANLALGTLALALRSPRAVRLALANLSGQALYVLGGLLLVRAPATVYRALAMAPVLMTWKVWLYLRIGLGRGPTGWVRTTRGGATPPAATPPHDQT